MLTAPNSRKQWEPEMKLSTASHTQFKHHAAQRRAAGKKIIQNARAHKCEWKEMPAIVQLVFQSMLERRIPCWWYREIVENPIECPCWGKIGNLHLPVCSSDTSGEICAEFDRCQKCSTWNVWLPMALFRPSTYDAVTLKYCADEMEASLCKRNVEYNRRIM